MSDVNKLDNKKCPFDLSKYKSNDVVAPVGSVPWAIIQVYEGKAVGRTEWNSLAEYIHLSTKNDGSGPIHIEKHNKDGISESWEPTPEDLMACDWELIKSVSGCPEDSVLVFDIVLGRYGSNWGYSSDVSISYGELNLIKNNEMEIQKIEGFFWNGSEFMFDVVTSENSESLQKIKELFENKNLQVIVDNVKYKLGLGTYFSSFDKYGLSINYQNDDAQKLSEILKQTGKTKRFCVKWDNN
ncbi:conserved protein of unknown function [Xenorhabdus poinarii G6]|uniref:DUF2829 domain-containing protein n=1 Tax=Xenorhabdus poinarii G6 TaxID=1354304 RepID=A0A068R2V9_9GAMM|nr:MW1434 family type I TA system toxin [Xenorhabdus poinarii]CDG21612.1 conserved protein of unknown function [Xenorhabdus poinarii G6]